MLLKDDNMLNNLEQKLKKWDNPLSDSEEYICSAAIRRIKEIINSDDNLKNRKIEIIEQGSHANKTNVRNNSDVDIAVICHQTFDVKLPPNKTDIDYGICDSDYEFRQFKMDVFQALANYFKIEEINYENKSIRIEHFKYNNSYISIDVVPFFEYKEYDDKDVFRTGVCFSMPDGTRVINYPKQHIENSIKKNDRTNHYYKRMVRCFKSLKYELEDNGYSFDNVKSFVLESIIYNMDDEVFDIEKAKRTYIGQYLEPYSAMFWNCILYAKNLLKNSSHTLYEPNGILKLFDKKDRNPKTYIDFFELLEKYCF